MSMAKLAIQLIPGTSNNSVKGWSIWLRQVEGMRQIYPCLTSGSTANIVNTLTTHQIPFLNVNGETGHSVNTGHVQQLCQGLVDMVKASGGDATNISLPDL